MGCVLQNTDNILLNEYTDLFGLSNALRLLSKSKYYPLFSKSNVAVSYLEGFRNDDGTIKDLRGELKATTAAKLWNQRNKDSQWTAVKTIIPGERSKSNSSRDVNKNYQGYGVVFRKKDELNFAFSPDTEDQLQFTKIKSVIEAQKRKLQDLQTRTYSIIKTLNKRINAKSDSKVKTELEDRVTKLKENGLNFHTKIQELEAQLLSYDEDKGLEFVTNLGDAQLSYVQTVLNKPEITVEELVETGSIIDTWKSIRDLLFLEENELPKEIADKLDLLANKASSETIYKRWTKLAQQEVKRQASFTTGLELREEDLKIAEDINFAMKFTHDISVMGNALVSVMDKELKNAAFKINSEFQHVEESINEKLKDLSEKDSELFWQKNESGEKTGGLVNEISDLYWSRQSANKHSLKAVINSKTADYKDKVKAYKKYFTWLRRSNVIIDPRFFVDSAHKDEKFRNSIEYKNFLIKEFGESKANSIIEKAVEKYEKWQSDEKLYVQALDDKVESGEITETEKSEKLKNFYLFRSPINFLNQKENFTQAENYYLSIIPRENIDGKSTGFYDENFAKIQEDPELLKKYEFVKGTIQEMLEYLPIYAKSAIKSNVAFIPEVQKDWLQMMADKNYKGFMEGLKELATNSITSEVKDVKNTPIDPFTKEPLKAIPINFVPSKGKIMDMDKRVTDFNTILKAFSYMALNYKHKSNIEDLVLLQNKVFQNTVERHKNGTGFKDAAQSAKNLKEVVNYTIEAELYNEKKKDELVVDKNVKLLNIKNSKLKDAIQTEFKKLTGTLGRDKAIKAIKEKYKNEVEIEVIKFKNLEDKRDKLEEDLESGKITQEQYDTEIKDLEEIANSVGRTLVFSKVIDKVIAFNQLKALGFNLFSAVNNYIFGVVSNIVHSAGRVDFTPKQAVQAFGLVTKSMFNLTNKNMDKVANMVAKFDLLSEVVESQFGESKGFNKTLEALKNAPYILLRSGDYFIKSQAMVAMMMNEKITDKSGKERSLWEAFDNTGNWKTEEFGENKDWNGNIGLDEGTNFINFRQKVMQTEKKLHGNFDPASVQMAKKYWIGRVLGQFRISWMPEGFTSRFGEKRFDALLNRDVEGRYRTMMNIGLKESLSIYGKLLAFQGSKAFENINEADRKIVEENMRKNMMEMYLYAMLTAVFIGLKNAYDDDDDWRKKGSKAVANTAYRVMSDCTFYLSPSTFTGIINEPFPILRTYKDFNRMRRNITKDVMDEDYDEELMWKSITNAFPYLNQYNKFKYMTEKNLDDITEQ